MGPSTICPQFFYDSHLHSTRYLRQQDVLAAQICQTIVQAWRVKWMNELGRGEGGSIEMFETSGWTHYWGNWGWDASLRSGSYRWKITVEMSRGACCISSLENGGEKVMVYILFCIYSTLFLHNVKGVADIRHTENVAIFDWKCTYQLRLSRW